MHEKCGVAGVLDLQGKRNAIPWLIQVTDGLQHRGELGAGIAWKTRDQLLHVLKDRGLVHEVLSPERAEGAEGSAGIGHTWYATCEGHDENDAQPYRLRETGIAYNGNLANYHERVAALLARGIVPKTHVDTEVLAQSFEDGGGLATPERMPEVFQHMEGELDGAFNVVTLDGQGRLSAYRDHLGIRPLSYSVIDGRYVVVASEDSAIKRVFSDARTYDVKPGQLLQAREGNMTLRQVVKSVRKRLCFFEFMYFAKRHSTIDGKSVETARYEAGHSLGEIETTNLGDAIVVAVPDSAKRSAQGLSDALGLPLEDGIEIASGYRGRTFIQGHPVNRAEKARNKYKLRPELLRGKRIILDDDSIVRGLTMQTLVERLWQEGGVKEIHVRIACPPVLSVCYYGMDFHRISELFARLNYNDVLKSGELPKEVLTTLAARMKVNSLRYLPVEAVPKILEPCGGICMACVNGECPTPCGQARREAEERTMHAK